MTTTNQNVATPINAAVIANAIKAVKPAKVAKVATKPVAKAKPVAKVAKATKATKPVAKVATKAKAEKVAKVEKPLSARAQIEADAAAGKLPTKLAFTSPGDKRYQKKVDLLNELAAKGDIKGLKAVEINAYSSSPKKMAKWRDLAVIALLAKAKRKAK